MGFFQMAKRYTLSPTDTLIARNSKASAFQGRLVDAVERLDVTPLTRGKLLTLTGVGRCYPTILLSDVTARIEASKILCQCAVDYVDGHVPEGTRMFHLTFADDIGLTSDRTPVLRMHAMQRKVDKAIRFLGLNGLAMSEVQPLANYPQKGLGCTLMLNSHALCWGDVSRRGFRESLRTLNQSRSWSNSFGALPIKSRELHHGVDDAHLIASYIAKVPYDAKRLVPHPPCDGDWRFRPTIEGYSTRLALRVAEGLSQYTIFDAVFGVCDGKHVRKEWKARLTDWHQEQLMDRGHTSSFDVAALWRKIRKRVGPNIYEPYAIE